jgi:hypothetical protein
VLDSCGDVVADQAHALDAVDAALGGLVGVPVAQLDAVRDVDLGLAGECDDQVDASSYSGSMGLGVSSARSHGSRP